MEHKIIEILLIEDNPVASRRFETSLVTGNDGELPVQVSISPLHEENVSSGTLAVFTDLSRRKKFEQRLRYLATHDELTGLPNRKLFHDRLDHAMARALRNRGSVAIMLLNLDNFKTINDTFGHHKGDLVLQNVAKYLHPVCEKAIPSLAWGVMNSLSSSKIPPADKMLRRSQKKSWQRSLAPSNSTDTRITWVQASVSAFTPKMVKMLQPCLNMPTPPCIRPRQ
jgi:hypothetical protein